MPGSTGGFVIGRAVPAGHRDERTVVATAASPAGTVEIIADRNNAQPPDEGAGLPATD